MSGVHGTSGVDASPVPGFEILDSLSTGGMSRIYLARQHALNRLVCVKIMSIPEGEDADSCRSRFCREAELLASVSHPHILSIFDFGATADLGLPFLVTEYIEGGDLRGRMIADEAMPIHQARSIVLQVGDALTHLHGKGILHRDLKPENILLPTESLVKVGDFGIAVMRDKAGSLTVSFHGMGTVGYVAPEQQYGLKVDERADEYSLAALSYELLTGRRPLGLFAPPSTLNPHMTSELDVVVLRGLAEEPKNRYASVREYVEAFDQALKSIATRRRLTRLPWLGLVIALLVVAGLWGGSRLGREPKVGTEGKLAASAIMAQQKPAQPLPQPDVPKPNTPVPPPPERSPELNRLIELRAYAIWVGQGRPTGVAGEQAKEKNWNEAERQIECELKQRAFKIWVKQGRPTGAAGDAVRETNMRTAEAEQLKETLEELLRHPLD
jgi:eukaryotic-like serine/threonine-protein kinase